MIASQCRLDGGADANGESDIFMYFILNVKPKKISSLLLVTQIVLIPCSSQNIVGGGKR